MKFFNFDEVSNKKADTSMWFDFMTKLKILIITFVHILVSDSSLQERFVWHSCHRRKCFLLVSIFQIR